MGSCFVRQFKFRISSSVACITFEVNTRPKALSCKHTELAEPSSQAPVAEAWDSLPGLVFVCPASPLRDVCRVQGPQDESQALPFLVKKLRRRLLAQALRLQKASASAPSKRPQVTTSSRVLSVSIAKAPSCRPYQKRLYFGKGFCFVVFPEAPVMTSAADRFLREQEEQLRTSEIYVSSCCVTLAQLGACQAAHHQIISPLERHVLLHI